MRKCWRSPVFLLLLAFSPAMCGRPGHHAVQYQELPLRFEANRGQTDPSVKFLARGLGFTLFLTPTEAVLKAPQRQALRMRLSGANPSARVVGRHPLPAQAHYFIGAGEETSGRAVDSYSEVEVEGVYPGVNLVYYSRRNQLEYDFVVAPMAKAQAISLAFEGAEQVRIDTHGDLIVSTIAGELRHHKPRAYQSYGHLVREVPSRYIVSGNHTVTFEMGRFDHTRPLRIDPVLSYSTYVGGNGGDSVYGVAADSSGCTYIVGETSSTDFPRTGSSTSNLTGYTDVIVAKLNPTASALVYSAYLGGSGRDSGRAIALDATGSVYVTGFTYSHNFPITAKAAQTAWIGSAVAFISKLSADGSTLLYSTYLGGSGSSHATGIGVDAAGYAYVTGYTSSTSFPTTVKAIQTAFRGGYYDGFIAKVQTDGSSLVYSTYIGGSGNDVAQGIAVTPAGNAYVVGQTASADFPVQAAFQSAKRGGADGFLANLSASGALANATFLGGSGTENATAVALDSSSNIYVTGSTTSSDFPVTAGGYQAVNHGGYDVFVSRFNPAGNGLLYSTYLGGSDLEEATAITVSASGDVLVAGSTQSSDFPTQDRLQPFLGGSDAFAVIFDSASGALKFSSYLGGSGDDYATGAAIDGRGNYVIAGNTLSTDLSTTSGAWQRTAPVSVNGFVAKLLSPPPSAVSVSPASGSGSAQTFTFVFSDAGGYANLRGAVLISPAFDGRNACYLFYDQASDIVHLANEDLSAWTAATLGTSAVIQNNQCSIQAGGTSASGSGSTLTLSLALTFKPAFVGAKNVYMYAEKVGGLVGLWQQLGTWTVPSSGQPPSAVSVSPGSGSGSAQTFTFVFSDAGGYANLRGAVLFSPAFDGRNACYLFYDQGSNIVNLANEDLSAWTAATLGTSAVIQNNQCSIQAGGSSASVSGSTLTLSLALTFKPAFVGTKNVYMYAEKVGGLVGLWQKLGAWTVPSSNQPPSAVSVSPGSGSGSAQTFTFVFSDAGGYANLRVAVLFSPAFDGRNACYLFYDHASSTVNVANEDLSAWEVATIGASSVIQNNQCSIQAGSSSASGSGSTLTLYLALAFKPAFVGAKNIYMYAEKAGGLAGGWRQLGAWTVPGT